MTKSEFFEYAEKLGEKAGVLNSVQRYFYQHRDRVYDTMKWFNLFSVKNSSVLEIGPFYSYTPFVFREKQQNKVQVYEGDDPVAHPLKKLFDEVGIAYFYADLFQTFGDLPSASRKLPYPDNSFDWVICWETMEHFNFNPVPFIHEIKRVLKPNGQASITVPNMAKLDKRLKLLRNRSIAPEITLYPEVAGGKCYSFHWREYTLSEIRFLFEKAGFKIEKSGYIMSFEFETGQSAKKAIYRKAVRTLTNIVPSFGNCCALKVVKPPA